MSIHFTHPKEITDAVKKACGELADAGIPLGSQTVLLKGINDKPYIMKKLVHELLKIRVRPYYIYQCDLAVGTEHFRTSVATGIQIIEKLRGYTTGYAVPTYVIDAPGGGGKIPIEPDYLVSRGKGKIVLRNYEGKVFEYPEPNIIEFKKAKSPGEEKTLPKKVTGLGKGCHSDNKTLDLRRETEEVRRPKTAQEEDPSSVSVRFVHRPLTLTPDTDG